MSRRNRPNTISGQFRPHLIEMIESPAWRALSLSARKALDRIEIELAHNAGKNNGELIVTRRDFTAYGVSPKAVEPALAELEALGFIRKKPGHPSPNPRHGRAARFRLTFRTGRGGPLEEHLWKSFKTDAAAEVAARLARAHIADRRKMRTSLCVEKEPLDSGYQTEPLSDGKEGNHCSRSKREPLSILSVGGAL
jgi:hypothetical protein